MSKAFTHENERLQRQGEAEDRTAPEPPPEQVAAELAARDAWRGYLASLAMASEASADPKPRKRRAAPNAAK